MAKNGKISFVNSIGGKILIIFVSVSILAIGTLAVISAMASSKALKAAASNQLEAIGDGAVLATDRNSQPYQTRHTA